MIKISSLGSSSFGNAYIVDDGCSSILLECGMTYKKLAEKIRRTGHTVSGLSGVLISHEHKDHAKAWKQLAKDGTNIYASYGTIQALKRENELAELIHELAIKPEEDVGQQVRIGSFDVIPFRTFHDAAEPIGFFIRSTVSGERLLFATDTVSLAYRFQRVNLIMIEANYYEKIIAGHTKIPDTLKKRIRNTHMEIDGLCRYLRMLDLSECKACYLMHLSDSNSDEDVFYRKVKAAVPESTKVYIFDRE